MTARGQNPYVGPRPFKETQKDRFFGREREIRELTALVLAHREVVLHSQSGAGKTSLLTAGLYPELQRRGIDLLPPARVRAEVNSAETSDDRNVHVESVLSFWPSLGEDVERTIPAYLSRRAAGSERTELRIIVLDQFEELYTAYPDRWKDREPFLEQIAEALDRDKRLRVLIAIRDEFVALLREAAPLFPEELRIWFHLQRLRQDAAERAIESPARLPDGTSVYEQGAAEELARRLRTSELSTGRAGARPFEGEFVEPVQLQIVCRRLWDATSGTITRCDLEQHANIPRALLDYYTTTIADVARECNLREAVLYRWFERELISPTGVRTSVRVRGTDVGGLPIDVVRTLDRRYLVRAEPRGDATYFELSHDRFLRAVQEAAKLRRARRRPLLIGGIAAIALLFVVLSMWFVRASSRAARARAVADATLKAENPAVYLERMLAAAVSRAPLVSAGDRDRIADALTLAINASAPRWTFAAGDRAVAAALSADGSAVTWVDANGVVRLVSLQVPKIDVVRNIGSPVTFAQFTADARYLLAASLAGEEVQVRVVSLDPATKRADANPAFRGLKKLTAAALSPDASRVALAGGDADGAVLQVYNVVSGALIWKKAQQKREASAPGSPASARNPEWEPEMRTIEALAFSASGERLSGVGSGRGTSFGRVWAAGSGKVEFRLIGHDRPIVSVAFSPTWSGRNGTTCDSLQIATADLNGHVSLENLSVAGDAPEGCRRSLDRAVALRRAARRKEPPTEARRKEPATEGTRLDMKPIAAHAGRTVVAFDGGVRLVTAGEDRLLKLWEASEQRPIHTITGHSDAVTQLAVASKARMIATVGREGVRVWDVSFGSDRAVPLAEVNAVAFGAGGTSVAINESVPAALAIYNIAALTEERRIPLALPVTAPEQVGPARRAGPGHFATGFNSLSLGAGNSIVMGRSFSRALELVDLREKAPALKPLPRAGLIAVAVHPSGAFAAAATWDGVIHIRQLIDPAQKARTLSHPNGVWDLTYSHDGGVLASSGRDGTVRLWDAKGAPIGDVKAAARDVRRVAFSPKDDLIATAAWDPVVPATGTQKPSYGVKIWNRRTRALVRTIPGHTRPVNGVAFDPTGVFVASAASDGWVRIARVDTGEVVHTFKAHTRAVRDVTYSPDGRSLATVGADGKAFVWTVSSPTAVSRTSEVDGSGPTWSVAFRRDGAEIVSATAAGTAIVWNPETQETRPLTPHSAAVNDAAFVGADGTVVTVSDDGTCRLWKTDGTSRPVVSQVTSLTRLADLAVHPTERLVAAVDAQGQLSIFSVDTGGRQKEVTDALKSASRLVIAPDGQRLALVAEDGGIEVRRWDTLAAVGKWSSGIRSTLVALANDGSKVAVAGDPGTPVLWNADGTGEMRMTGSAPQAIAVTLDARAEFIATIGVDDRLRIWSIATRNLVATLPAFGAESALFGAHESLVTIGPSHIARYPLDSLRPKPIEALLAEGFRRTGGSMDRVFGLALEKKNDAALEVLGTIADTDAGRRRAENMGLVRKLQSRSLTASDLVRWFESERPDSQ